MPTVKETFDQMPSKFRADKAAGVNATIQYDITGDQGGTWNAVIKDGACNVASGAAAEPEPDPHHVGARLDRHGDRTSSRVRWPSCPASSS